MTDAEYREQSEKEEKEKQELYQKIIDTANDLEVYRLMLYQNKTHKENLHFSDEFQHVDDVLFSIQSQLRNLYEYCNC